jgi:hypothetical protein
MNYAIKLKEGIDQINFGLSIENVCSLLSSPSEVEEIGEDIDYPTTILHYENQGLSLFFDNSSQESALSCIDVHNPQMTIFDKKVMGSSIHDIEQLMIKNGVFNETMEKEDWGEERISFEEKNIDFYFNDGKLISITFGK